MRELTFHHDPHGPEWLILQFTVAHNIVVKRKILYYPPWLDNLHYATVSVPWPITAACFLPLSALCIYPEHATKLLFVDAMMYINYDGIAFDTALKKQRSPEGRVPRAPSVHGSYIPK